MKILVPSDGSAASLDAVRHVLGLTREGLSAQIVLANVQEPARLYEMLMTPEATGRDAAMRSAGRHALAPAWALLAEHGVACEHRVMEGDPAQALLELAETDACDAIVMGTRGHGLLGGRALGSVARAVLEGAKVAVTIVRHGDADIDAAADASETAADAPGAGTAVR